MNSCKASFKRQILHASNSIARIVCMHNCMGASETINCDVSIDRSFKFDQFRRIMQFQYLRGLTSTKSIGKACHFTFGNLGFSHINGSFAIDEILCREYRQ